MILAKNYARKLLYKTDLGKEALNNKDMGIKIRITTSMELVMSKRNRSKEYAGAKKLKQLNAEKCKTELYTLKKKDRTEH